MFKKSVLLGLGTLFIIFIFTSICGGREVQAVTYTSEEKQKIQELRTEYQDFFNTNQFVEDVDIMEEMPHVESAPYKIGVIKDSYKQQTLQYVNFYRKIAGMKPVVYNSELDIYTQGGSAYLAAVDNRISHYPNYADKPDYITDENFNLASKGVAKSNLGWYYKNNYRYPIDELIWDPAQGNLSTGHRNDILKSSQTEMSVGLVTRTQGKINNMRYYALQLEGQGEDKALYWPSAGVFPVNFMKKNAGEEFKWVIDPPLSEKVNFTKATVKLKNITQNKEWIFDDSSDADVYSHLSIRLYIRPKNIEYKTNDEYQVSVTGITNRYNGEPLADISYTVKLFDLNEKEVNVSVESIKGNS